jgi:hypothetical protein
MLPTLNTGDIILYSGHKPLARAIQFFEHSKWNHAGLVIDIWGEKCVIEATGKGVHHAKIEDSIKGSIIMVRRPVFDFDEKGLCKSATLMCGNYKYDFFDLVVRRPFFEITGKWVFGNSSNRMICSEVPTKAFNQVDARLFIDWNTYDPARLAVSPFFHTIYEAY